jgi:hypothetical protein
MLNLTDPGNFGMVVEDFGGEEVEFAGEQHAHHQGVHPILVAIFSPPSQRMISLFPNMDLMCLPDPAPISR